MSGKSGADSVVVVCSVGGETTDAVAAAGDDVETADDRDDADGVGVDVTVAGGVGVTEAAGVDCASTAHLYLFPFSNCLRNCLQRASRAVAQRPSLHLDPVALVCRL